MAFFRTLAFAGFCILTAAIIWAFGQKPIGQSAALFLKDPWGIVSLVDLYLGFTMVSILIWLLEANKAVALAFIVPTFILGNVMPALWVLFRLARSVKPFLASRQIS